MPRYGLLLLFSCAFLLWAPVAPAAAQAVEPAASDHATPLGFHVNRGDSAEIQAAAAAGADFVVVVFSWRDIEPTPGYIYWERPDATLRAADHFGLDVVARLDRPPDWALDDRDPTPWRLDAYAAFAGRVAARHGDRLAGVILWNEPNLALEWHDSTPDPDGYAAMLAAAAPAVKAQAPDLPVLMAGLAFTQGDGVTAMHDLDYLAAVLGAGGGDHVDGFALHPYGFGRPPDDAPDPDMLNFRRLELHRELAVAQGYGDKAFWITEMGWRTSAPNPADAWQVVTPAQQADYTLAALDRLRTVPWLTRVALWELVDGPDLYGYALWQGPERVTPTYARLAAQAMPREPAEAMGPPRRTVPILAPDASVRLGDIGTLHPHWVHLYQGGARFSPAWHGDFFLSPAEADQPYTLYLETMQIDQAANPVLVNGRPLGHLRARTRLDPTSTWVTQRLTVPQELLEPGLNRLTVASGLRNPVRQYSFWRWENLQLRNVRLAQPGAAEPTLTGWQPAPSPSGWDEIIRLRAVPVGEGYQIWATGNRPGHIWRADQDAAGRVGALESQAANRGDTLFLDVLALDGRTWAATAQGLMTRGETGDWLPVAGAPPAYAYVLVGHDNHLYAGFEELGVWRVPMAGGRWRHVGLAGVTVLDLLSLPGDEALIAATDSGLWRMSQGRWLRESVAPATDVVTLPDPGFFPRLFPVQTQPDASPAPAGAYVARNLNSLWFLDAGQGWTPVGPPAVIEDLLSVAGCCADGALAGADLLGLWRRDGREWQRVDGDFFSNLKLTGLVQAGPNLYAATDNGLFVHRGPDDLTNWRKLEGLPATLSDLMVDPTAPARWLAGTPAGVYRSRDAGATWEAVSPPWVVWDMAFGPQGRLFVARSDGVAFTDDLAAPQVAWRTADGLERVTFFQVAPHPTDPAMLWAGSWGNDVGVSRDGGATLASLGNGLETLSVLHVLHHAVPGQYTLATIEGLYRSDDDGATWFKLPGPLQRQTVHALYQGDDGLIWAGAADGLWRSADYGVTWERADALPPVTVLRLGALTWDDVPLLWAGTEEAGLWLSRDNGATWVLAGLPARSVYNVLVDDQGRLVAATNAGIFQVAGE